ncbi:hypothetical protein L2D00_10020 [Hyphomonadaceae bacterium BL14]|nr:hypothetical protein L2D00_10020 [Hyphomonadaceae bacterium BL14]
MSDTVRIILVMVTAGLFCGMLAAVVVAAFGWPLSVAALLAGAGAGAAGVATHRRMKASKAAMRPTGRTE